MSIRRFRKSVTPWRTICFACGLVLFLIFRTIFPLSRTSLDPTRLNAASGDYIVQSVLDSSLLRLVPSTVDSRAPLEIELLATDVVDPLRVAECLRGFVGERSSVNIRFDRRRISEDTKRLQAYVFVGEICLNEEIVRQGLAKEDTHPSDAGPMIRRIKKAEQEAREHRRGIWGQTE